jgi:hypothetical protein
MRLVGSILSFSGIHLLWPFPESASSYLVSGLTNTGKQAGDLMDLVNSVVERSGLMFCRHDRDHRKRACGPVFGPGSCCRSCSRVVRCATFSNFTSTLNQVGGMKARKIECVRDTLCLVSMIW